jgi:hypothetical protein
VIPFFAFGRETPAEGHLKTPGGAPVAPQHCRILRAGKSIFSLTRAKHCFNVKYGVVGVKSEWRHCQIIAAKV